MARLRVVPPHLVAGAIVRAEDVPEGRVVRTLQTHRIGVVVEQKHGACLVDFAEPELYGLHPRVMLEIAE